VSSCSILKYAQIEYWIGWHPQLSISAHTFVLRSLWQHYTFSSVPKIAELNLKDLAAEALFACWALPRFLQYMNSEYRSEISMNTNRNFFWLVLTSVLSEVSPNKMGHRRESAWWAPTSLCCQVMSLQRWILFLGIFSKDAVVLCRPSLYSRIVAPNAPLRLPANGRLSRTTSYGPPGPQSHGLYCVIPREDAQEARNDRGNQGK
jgi:hypothetical protein